MELQQACHISLWIPSAARLSTPSVAKMPLPHAEIRAKLEKVLSDDASLCRSAKATFRQFDKDNSGTLNFRETKALLEKLCDNLQLPPIDPSTLHRIIMRYDSEESEDSCLSLEEFARMYRDLLLLIQEKYYPRRTIVVHRANFVGHRYLQNETIEKFFKFKKKLGAGSFGEVHLAQEIGLKQDRVVKIINKKQAALPLEQIFAEISILKNLDHPNIIKIFEVFEDYNNVYIVQEVCAGGELMDRVAASRQSRTRFSERSVAETMRRLLEAVSYCHDKKIAHKDLKPENIMFLTKEQHSPIKVIDFGVAECFNRIDGTSHRAAGTALYMAPEVFEARLGLKCDIWSLGCVMYLMLTGKLPFIGRSLPEVQHKVSRNEPNYEHDCRGLSVDAIEVMRSMLIKNPTIRPSAKRILGHPWFKNEHDTEYLTPEICNNLQNYMRQSHLKNALVNMMVHQMTVSAPQVQKLANLFRTLDRDGNGVLTAAELSRGLTGAGWRAWDVHRIVSALDIDGSGEIDYTEFLAACYSWRETEMNVVWSAFSKIDSDGDGRITTDEFIQVLLGGDSNLVQRHQLEEMIKQVDKNGDGCVEWDEFLDYIRSDGSRPSG